MLFRSPPGSSYPTIAEAWQEYYSPFDEDGYSSGGYPFDSSYVVPGGDILVCTATDATTDRIICDDTSGLLAGQEIVFTNAVIGGITQDQIYYVKTVVSPVSFTISTTQGGAVFGLTTEFGNMAAEAANQRMAIYTITVDQIGRAHV